MAKAFYPGAQGVPSPVGVSAAEARARLKQDTSCWADYYVGTAHELIEAGLISADQFPEKSMATYLHGVRVKQGTNTPRGEGYLQVRRAGTKFRLEVGVSAEEERRRREERARQRAAKEQEEQASQEREARERLAAFYATPEQLRSEASVLCRRLGWLLANHTPGDHERHEPKFACRFSPEGITDILDSLREVHEWIEEATITRPDPTAQKFQAARKDAAFQAFLASQCIGEE